MNTKLWIHVAVPWALFVVVLGIGISQTQCGARGCKGPGKSNKPENWNVAETIDWYFRNVGPAFPFLLILIQLLVLPFSSLVEEGIFKEKPQLEPSFGWLAQKVQEKGWAWVDKGLEWGAKLWTLSFVIYAVRLTIYALIMRPLNYYVSDHVFLATSMIAQIQCLMAVSGHAFYAGKTKQKTSFFMLCCCWLLLVVLYYETYVTARFFHTWVADCVGLLVGLALFGSLAFWWTYDVDTSLVRKDSLLNTDYSKFAS